MWKKAPSHKDVWFLLVGTGVLDCPQIELTQYGEIADKYIKRLNDFYEHLSVEKYLIMPNHIHLLLWVKENRNKTDNGQSRTPVPTNCNIPYEKEPDLSFFNSSFYNTNRQRKSSLPIFL